MIAWTVTNYHTLLCQLTDDGLCPAVQDTTGPAVGTRQPSHNGCSSGAIARGVVLMASFPRGVPVHLGTVLSREIRDSEADSGEEISSGKWAQLRLATVKC